MGTITCKNTDAPDNPVEPPNPPGPIDPPPDGACTVCTLPELRECLADGEKAYLTKDITVGANDCEGPGVINFTNAQGTGIDGQGYTINRTGGQGTCSLIYGANAQGVDLTNVKLEEPPGPEVPGVHQYEKMVHFVGGGDICMQNVEVCHAWDYAIYTNGVSGFKFKDSILRDSGVLGLYIGHTQGNANTPTTDVEICDNVFLRNTTNALAVLGGVNVNISNNTFCENHIIGVFPVAPQFGTAFTGGGQVYIAEANFIDMINNTIKEGFCPNCYNNWVSGIETGLPNQGATVTNANFINNIITNNSGKGFGVNTGSILGSDVVISGNFESGNGLPSQYSNANYSP